MATADAYAARRPAVRTWSLGTMASRGVSLFGLFVLVTLVHANQPPSFVNTIDLATVKENAIVGSAVSTIKAVDPENSRLTYGLRGTDLLRVDTVTGLVTVAKAIDREAVGDRIQFEISVEDTVGRGSENNVVRVPVTVLVIDENDVVPCFKGIDQLNPLQVTVSEDAPVGTALASKFVAEDVDLVGSVLKVTCTGCGHEFAIILDDLVEPTTNRLEFYLTLATPVEYQPRKDKRAMTLVISDGSLNSSLNVQVTIADVQNRPPMFIGSTSAIIPEDSLIGTLVMKLRAIDGDVTVDSMAFDDKETIGRKVVYELTQSPFDWFALDRTTGELRVAAKLDKEAFPATSGVVTLQVKAVELDEKGLSQAFDPLAVSTVTLTITLQDINDENPKAPKSEYRVTVPEGVANGTPLAGLDLVIEDKDSGSNSVFNVALVDPSGHFSVEPTVATSSTAVSIRVANGPLDFENPNQRKFILLVVATEALTTEKLSSTSTVIVSVLDTNDNKPEFLQDMYTASVQEDSAPGTIVATIRATDRDSPQITALEYSLFGNGAQLFSVNPTTGAITVADCPTPGAGNCIDFETRQSYFLSFQASDGFGQSSVVPLTIHITDSNDNVPVFSRGHYSATIDEGSLKFEPPLRVKATDADVTSIVTFSIVEGNVEGLFMMDARSGEIKVNGPVRSIYEVVVLKVHASDGGKGIASAMVTIRIRDSNDNNPIFERPIYTASISETAPPGTFVEQLAASDGDSGLNAKVEYRIRKGAFDEFVISPNSGVVAVSPVGHSRLDYDRRSSYDIEVVAVDKGVPPRSGTATLKVTIMNHNDKSPYFEPATQRTQVNENAEVGMKFYHLLAKDPDVGSPDSLVYSIVSIAAIDKRGSPLDQSNPRMAAVNGFFAVESRSGDIVVANKINRELASVVTLKVSVTDVSSSIISPQFAVGTLVITIVDHNDHAPTFGAPWSPERPELTVSTLEEQPVGTVLMNLLATDLDSKVSHYVIDPPSSYFEIGRESGVLTIKKVIDYETVVKESRLELDPRIPKYPNQLRFQVFAYDSGLPQLSAHATVHVNVLNINDNEPIFNQTAYFASVKENAPGGAFVAQVKATDADYGKYGKISYSIISVSGNGYHESASRSYFTISNETGVIRVAPNALIDREKGPKKMTLQVAATDEAVGSTLELASAPQTYSASERSRRMISVPIYITIEDVNDGSPSFSQAEYEATTLGHVDGATARVPVIQVSALDPDDGLNGQVTYKIKAGNSAGIFEINSESGAIYAIKSPTEVNPEKAEYKLTIEARDVAGQGPFADEAVVRVKVIQVNRHKPKFLFPSSPTVDFAENQKPGSKILRVQVFDADSGHNGVVRCSFKVNGSANVQETEQFKIDPDSGLIVSKIPLDRESRASYDLVLVAQDYLGEPQVFESLQQLTVVIKDVDDNRAEFERAVKSDGSRSSTETYPFSIYENEPRGAVVGKLTAMDKDADEENRQVFYHVIDGNQENQFHLDKNSGVLFANISFDRELRDTFELVIKASSKDKLPYDQPSTPASNGQVNVRDRSFNADDLSLALVVVRIRDKNDNRPQYAKQVFRAGISERADIGTVVSVLEAADPDLGQNSSISYTIVATDLYRKGYDLPDSPVRPIPSPFSYDQDGRIIALQLMSQYPVGSRFVLHLEARENAPPHGVSHSKLMVWIYDPSKLIKITVKLSPEFVNNRRDELEEILSSATQLRAVVLEIKYHHDTKRGRLVREWSDLYVLVVDDRAFGDVHPARVIAKLDSNSRLHREKPMLIDHISLASTSELSVEEEVDFATALLAVLLSLLLVGFISSAVACCCLKSWYQQKLIARARKAAIKAKAIAIKEREVALSIRDSTLRISDARGATGTKTPTPKANADKRQQQPTRSPTDNPLWTESALKFYEEQEMSMQVTPGGELLPTESNPSTSSSGQNTPPADLYADGSHYATLMEAGARTKSRQRQPDTDNHEYHELVDTTEPNSASGNRNSDLAVNAKGEPELVTQLM